MKWAGPDRGVAGAMITTLHCGQVLLPGQEADRCCVGLRRTAEVQINEGYDLAHIAFSYKEFVI